MLLTVIDARLWLREESARQRRPVTLDSLPPASLDGLADQGLHGLWLRGPWEPDPEARRAAQRSARTLEACAAALPDLELEDLEAHPDCAASLEVDGRLGGRAALAELRDDLHRRGLALWVDLPCQCGTAVPAPRQLEIVAAQADGVVIKGGAIPGAPGWLAMIPRARKLFPRVQLIAEGPAAESQALLAQGFDHVLDTAWATRLASATIETAHASMEVAGSHWVRGLELDGERAARRLAPAVHEALAVLAYLAPGVRILAHGETEGRRMPGHPCLVRRPVEPIDRDVASFYERLLEVVARVRPEECTSRALPLRAAWEGSESWRGLVVYVLERPVGEAVLVAANCSDTVAQGYVSPELAGAGDRFLLEDLFSLAVYERERRELSEKGLYLELGPWDYNAFSMSYLATVREVS